MYTVSVWRMHAMLLLAAIGFGLVTPMLLAQPEASKLPACCRRDGKHGCAMKAARAGKSAASGVSLSSTNSKCPLYPTGKATPTPQKISVPPPVRVVVAPVLEFAEEFEQAEVRFRISYSRSGQKRGPPSLFP